MKKLKNVLKKIPLFTQINGQRLRIQKAILHKTRLDLTSTFLQFSPNSLGSYKKRAALTVQTINNVFPCLAALLQSEGRKVASPIDIKDFPKGPEDLQSSLNIKELLDCHGSDKAYPQNYHWLYGSILKNRHTISSVLEIGLGTNNSDIVSHMGHQGSPGASLRAFRDFLPNAEIYGADIDRRILFAEERIKTFFVDQTNRESFEGINKFLPRELDLIIDDGLHSPDANINTLHFALSKIKSGGWVVIEDIRGEARPIWTLVSCILPKQFECYLLESVGQLIFAVQRRP